jgi:nucleoid-associated protein EbfC
MNFNPNQLRDLMSQAKQQYESLQKRMAETVVDASSGGGTVSVKMNGQKRVLEMRIDPEAVKSGDVEMLQDLVMAAVNEAGRKVEAELQNSLGGMLGGMGGMFGQ